MIKGDFATIKTTTDRQSQLMNAASGLLAARLILKFPGIDEKCPKLTTIAAAVFQSYINFRTKPLYAWEEFISPIVSFKCVFSFLEVS